MKKRAILSSNRNSKKHKHSQLERCISFESSTIQLSINDYSVEFELAVREI